MTSAVAAHLAPSGLPETETPRSRAESLAARLAAGEAQAALEHLFGVRPLVEVLFDPEAGGTAAAEIAAGRRVGSLGLFTPTPGLDWEEAAVEGRGAAAELRLHGQVRVANPAADGSLVLVRLEGPEHRLAWVDHGAPGVERRGFREGGEIRAGLPGWLVLDGAAPGLLSRPVGLEPGGVLSRCLDTYAAAWALAAADRAGREVRGLRRTARTTVHGGAAFSTAQQVAMDLTEVEIEAELALLAARRYLDLPSADGLAGLAIAAGAARALAAATAARRELQELLGLEPTGEESGEAMLGAGLGGLRRLESEVARSLGIRGAGGGEEAG